MKNWRERLTPRIKFWATLIGLLTTLIGFAAGWSAAGRHAAGWTAAVACTGRRNGRYE